MLTGSHPSRRLAPLALALAIACAGSVAGAQPADGGGSDADKAAALQAFEDGLDLEKKADYAAALEKFQKVGAFKMTPHVRFHVALCEEKLGKLVSALHGFELAAAEAVKMGKDAQIVADKAPARAEALRKRVASVRIEVTGKVLHSRVLIDGQPVLEKDFGTLINVDPGAHVIAVDTDGVLSQKKEVTLGERGYETITFQIDDKEKPIPTATATTSAPPQQLPPPPASKVPAFVLGGAGVLSLIGAGVFYGLRASALDSFATLCPADRFPPDKDGSQHCPPSAQGPRDDAQTFTVTAGMLLGVGVAALGGAGAYFLFTRRSTPAQPPKPALGVSLTSAGIRLTGEF